jgi:vitamin B12 transporter
VALAASRSDGPILHGDHDFRRANLRIQRVRGGGQTDLVAGYQSKFFGWPNLYTPFNSPESENLQTVLVALHHRQEAGPDDWLEAGAYYRRHKDDYAFNRFAAVGPMHPFQHTTWVWGAGLEGRRRTGEVGWAFSASVLADEIRSTSLTFGRFRSRSHAKAALAPERMWEVADGRRLRVRAGVAFDDTNRDGSGWAPAAEIALEPRAGAGKGVRLHAAFARSSQTATYTALNASPSAGLFRGNPNLGRQIADTLEAGAAVSRGRWSVAATAFLRRDDDLVDWTFRKGVTARTANAVDLETLGLEAVARYSGGAWDVIASYSALTKDADYGGAAVDGSFYALNFPGHRLTLALTARLGAGWEVRVDNEARVQEDNPLRRRGGDEAFLSSVGVLYTVPRWPRLTLLAQVDNLWDEAFEEVPAVPATPRQVSVGFRYRFKGWR